MPRRFLPAPAIRPDHGRVNDTFGKRRESHNFRLVNKWFMGHDCLTEGKDAAEEMPVTLPVSPLLKGDPMTLSSLLKTSAAALIVSAGMASAATTFTGSWAVSFNQADPGLVISVDAPTGTGSLDLELGQSATFNIFDLWTTETAVNGDDTVAKPISAAFTLTTPGAGSGSVNGSTVGVSTGWGFYQAGKLTWDEPLQLTFGNTGVLEIELSNASFQPGYFGLSDPFGTYVTCEKSKGKGHDKGHGGKVCTENTVFYGAEVMAKVTYVTADTPDAPAPVPLPAAGLGLVAGLGALGLLRRRAA